MVVDLDERAVGQLLDAPQHRDLVGVAKR